MAPDGCKAKPRRGSHERIDHQRRQGIGLEAPSGADLVQFLAMRGARTVDGDVIASAFPDARPPGERQPAVRLVGPGSPPVPTDNQSFPGFERSPAWSVAFDEFLQAREAGRTEQAAAALARAQDLRRRSNEALDVRARAFAIYAPEHSALRVFQQDGQLLPLGIRGEGLFGHLKHLSRNPETAPLLAAIGNHLALLGWFDSFEIPKDLAPGEQSILIRDRFLAEGALFDQRSANEGFLYLLFYFTLLASPETPRMFAIDNVDASLNPKLCTALGRKLVELAKQHDRQCLLTTHNPAFLDGLDLHDDEQRLFVVERSLDGETLVRT